MTRLGSRLTYVRRVVAGKILTLDCFPPELKKFHPFDAVGGVVWPASQLLVNYLTSSNVAKNANVLELGSGCGYVGIACAALGASHVTLTDRKLIMESDGKGGNLETPVASSVLLDLCGRNIEANRPHIGSCSMDVQELEWGKQNANHVEAVLKSRTHTTPYNLIVGSELTYLPDISKRLFWTAAQLMKRNTDTYTDIDTSSNNRNEYSMGSNKKRLASAAAAAARAQAPRVVAPVHDINDNSNNNSNDKPNDEARFLLVHEHKTEFTAAHILSLARSVGLHCTTLASSSGRNSSNTKHNSDVDVSNITVNDSNSGASGSDSKSSGDSPAKEGDYVLWQFTL